MSVEVDGVDEVQDLLSGVADRCDDMTPAMRQVAEKIRQTAARCFADRRGPDGTAWPPLAPHTVKYRKPNGALEQSVFAEPRPDGVTFGSTASYAAYQNETRPFLPTELDEETLAEIAKYITDGE